MLRQMKIMNFLLLVVLIFAGLLVAESGLDCTSTLPENPLVGEYGETIQCTVSSPGLQQNPSGWLYRRHQIAEDNIPNNPKNIGQLQLDGEDLPANGLVDTYTFDLPIPTKDVLDSIEGYDNTALTLTLSVATNSSISFTTSFVLIRKSAFPFLFSSLNFIFVLYVTFSPRLLPYRPPFLHETSPS